MHDPNLAAEALASLPPDIATSPLFSADLAPVPPARRTWNTYAFAALWISMCHCIPTYTLASGMLAAGMTWWMALGTIALGTMIVLVPILMNAHPGTKYGVPFPVLARASYGTVGANFPAMLRAVVACGWFGINCYFGGEGVSTVIEAIWPGWATLGGGMMVLGYALPHMLAFLVFWALNVFIIYRGMEFIRVFENWAAPLVLVMAAFLLVWVISRAGLGAMLSEPANLQGKGLAVFFTWVTAVVGFWSTLALNIPDFTRFGKGQREQLIGQTLGLPTTMIAFSLMAVVITSSARALLHGLPPDQLAALWDPVKILAWMTSEKTPPGLDGPLFASGAARLAIAILGVIGVSVASVSVNIAANVVSPANDIANLAPRRISFKTGGLITAIAGFLFFPWKLVNHGVDQWLIGYSALLGPICGIMIVDYWVIRKKELDVPELYRPNGKHAGTNWIAVGATIAGILPNVPGFLEQVKLIENLNPVLHWIYVFAWFVGFGVAGGLYYLGMTMKKKPAAAA